MRPTRYDHLCQHFLAISELEGGPREAYLDDLRGKDPGLHDELLGLLEHSERVSTTWFGARTTPDELGPLPRDLGSYRVEEELGRGGMGVVYRAVDTRLQRTVALKTLPARASAGQRDFRREARLLAALNHPNIAMVFSLDEVEDVAFFTLELVEGESLDRRLARGPLTIEETLRLADELSRALEAAHSAGIVHLDLKPGNIVLGPSGQAKVLDFGIARSLGDEPSGAGGVVGTPGYMSPEQVLGLEPDARADLYSLGCVLFECLSGRPVCDTTDLVDVKELLKVKPDYSLVPASTPAQLVEVVQACLSHDRDQRIGSAAEVRAPIDELRAEPAEAILPSDHLPTAPTPLVGRKRTVEELERLLKNHRLVTVTGLGGTGKTRLALEVARRALQSHGDRVSWIDFSPFRSSVDVVQATAKVLGVPGKEPCAREIVEHLSELETLLVFDNCEHLREAIAALTEEILRGTNGVRLMTTSREALGVSDERVLSLLPLEVPADDAVTAESIRASESVQLLLLRAEPRGFVFCEDNAGRVASVCRRLEGIPLALELAASRLELLSIADLEKRLERRFVMLKDRGGAALRRHDTLRATLDFSYELLDPAERTLFRRLAVFPHGWTLGAAEAVASGEEIESWDVLDLIAGLIDKSLVVVSEVDHSQEGETRYRFLETVREYAAECLTHEEDEVALQERFIEYHVQQAAQAEEALSGSSPGRWLQRLDREGQNYQAAIERARTSPGRLGSALEIAVSIWRFWETRSYFTRGLETLVGLIDAVEASGEEVTGTLCAKAAHGASRMASLMGEYKTAIQYHEQGIELERKFGDEETLAGALVQYAVTLKMVGEFDRAQSIYEESLEFFRRQNNSWFTMTTLVNLGALEGERGDTAAARAHYEEALALARDIGQPRPIAVLLNNMAIIDLMTSEFDAAERGFEEAIDAYRDIGDRKGAAQALGNLGLVAFNQGNPERAINLLEQGVVLRRELGDRSQTASTLSSLVQISAQSGDLERSREWLVEAIDLVEESGENSITVLECSAVYASRREQNALATRLFAAAMTRREASGVLGPERYQRERQERIDALREELGSELFEKEWAAGQTLSEEEAFREARTAAR